MLYKNGFEQLQKITDEIKHINDSLQKAYSHKDKQDYETCLWTLRNTLEAICKNVYMNEISTDVKDIELRIVIKKLDENDKIPHHILPHIRNVQTFGNHGSHPPKHDDVPLTEKMIQPAIASMEIVNEWFVNVYHGVPKIDPQKSLQKLEFEKKQLLALLNSKFLSEGKFPLYAFFFDKIFNYANMAKE